MGKTENRLAFLVAYERICRNFGVLLTGCGCCGSPFLLEVDPDDSERRTNSRNLDAHIAALRADETPEDGQKRPPKIVTIINEA